MNNSSLLFRHLRATVEAHRRTTAACRRAEQTAAVARDEEWSSYAVVDATDAYVAARAECDATFRACLVAIHYRAKAAEGRP